MHASLLPFRGFSAAVLFVVATVPITEVVGQCTTQWVPREGPSCVDSLVRATKLWDPDGAGPLPPVVVVGGRFTLTTAGATSLHIAAYEPATGTWSALGRGTDGVVHALATLPNGDLLAAGEFTHADGVPCNRVARWNGSVWQPLGAGVDDDVFALTILPNGDVIAGGAFKSAGGAMINRIARWNGAQWSPLGSGMDAPVRALTTMANGHVVAGGTFTTAGGATARRIARWDGAAWSWMGGGANPNSAGVYSLLTLANGDVVAGGSFTTMGSVSASNIARWTNGSWLPIGGTNVGVVRAIAQLPNGDVVANGSRWNGATWSFLGSSSLPFFWPDVYSLAVLPGGDLVSAGSLPTLMIPPQLHFARWNGTAWSPLASDFDGPVATAVTMPNGHVVAVGQFFVTPGGYFNNLARWNGTTWSAVGSAPFTGAYPLTTLPNGDLIAYGQFDFGGGPVDQLAAWNGTSWYSLGPAMTITGGVTELVILQSGDWIAAGNFTSIGGVVANGVARWNGTAWAPLGTGTAGANSQITSLVVVPNGDVVVGGLFTSIAGVPANRIARWNGTAWSALGSGLTAGTNTPGVYDVHLTPRGDLIVAGDFTRAGGAPAHHVARWDGGIWRPLGAGTDRPVAKIVALPNGDLVASGWFTRAGGFPANKLARWNGVAWAALASGPETPGFVLASLADGDLLIGGLWPAPPFVSTGGTWLTRLTTTCPALAATAGNGCAGSGGANVLVATSLPWVGATHTARATGMPANGLAVHVLGFATASVPLSAILPQALPGCTLLVAPSSFDVRLPAAGSVTTHLAIPNTIALATQALHEQVIAFELGAGGAITAVTSTNPLALTIGAF